MPSTFLVSDFSNLQSGQLTEPYLPLQNATLTFLGCPSRHTEINLNFDLIQALSSGSPASENLASGCILISKCEGDQANERINMSSKSPTPRSRKIKKQQPEPVPQFTKKEHARNQTSQVNENWRKCREAKNTFLERGESQGKGGNDDRMSTFYFESTSKTTDKSPRRAASLDKNSHTSSEGKPQRKRSRERSGEVKVFSRLRTCLKGLKQKSQASQLTETQISNMQLNRVLEQKTLNMHRQLRLPKAQGDMEILSKGTESFKNITENQLDSNSALADSNIQNYAGCSVENASAAAAPCHSHQRSRTRGYPTIDKMFIDVLKTLIMQSGPDSGCGITSIYDGRESSATCTYKMENEMGKSNNADDVITSGDDSEASSEKTLEEAWSNKDANGRLLSNGDRTDGAIQCDGDKNYNHSAVGYDEFEDEMLGGFDAEQTDTSEYDVPYEDIPGNTMECQEIHIRNTQDVAQQSKEFVNLSEIHYQSNITHTKCQASMIGVAYQNHFSEAIDNGLNRWETIQFSRNHNNSVNDDVDNLERPESSSRNEVNVEQKLTATAGKNLQRHVTGESHCITEQSQEQGMEQSESYNNIVIKLTPPSPPSSPEDVLSPPVPASTYDRCALLSVPEVYMSLRARFPNAELLEMAAVERFRSNDGVEKELEDLCSDSGSGIVDFHNRPNSSQTSRNFITAYIERAREVLRNVRVRPMSPQNVLDKINKYCEKAKDEARLIKSWSFSELITPVCKGHRSTSNKFRFTDFKSKWVRFQSDGCTDIQAEDTSEKKTPSKRPGDAHSPIFCLNTRLKNDDAYDGPVEALNGPGSSQSNVGHASSCRPQPVFGRASTAVDKCCIVKGCGNIQESITANEMLKSKPEVFESCERRSAFFRYGETSTDVNVTTYPRHIDTYETLIEMNEEDVKSSSQHPCGVDESSEHQVEAKILKDNFSNVERSASMLTSLSSPHVQHDNANQESRQGHDEFLKSVPQKSQSLLQVNYATQGESCDVMSMLSQEVTIKRYPSFADLTDLNDDHQKFDASLEAKQGTTHAREAESYDQVKNKQKINTDLTNVTPFDGCIEIEIVGGSAEKSESKKLTPPNSPNLGVLVGARVQTIVSLLESCSALRSESERVPNPTVHLESSCRSTPGQSKQDETETNFQENPNKCPNELSLPSPPITSPGDSTSNTLDDTNFPVETYEDCIASTSKFATDSQQCFKNRQTCIDAVLSNNGDEFEKHTLSNTELKESLMCKNMQNPDNQGIDDSVLEFQEMNMPTKTALPEYSSRCLRSICKPMEIIKCKDSGSFSISTSDSELQLNDVCNEDLLSDEEEYLEQDKDVEVLQPAQCKYTKSCIMKRTAGDAGQIINTQTTDLKSRIKRKLARNSNQRKEARLSKAELKNKKAPQSQVLQVTGVEMCDNSRSKHLPRKIKWVTERPPDEDEFSLQSAVNVSPLKAVRGNLTQSANVAQGSDATPDPNHGTPDENDGSNVYLRTGESKTDNHVTGSTRGSKSDLNNNVSTSKESRWNRLHKGIPFNSKAPKISSKPAPDSDDKKSNASCKDKLSKSTTSSRWGVFDKGVKVDVMKNVVSLSKVSQVVGVTDPEDTHNECINTKSDFSIISNGATAVNSSECQHVSKSSSLDFQEEKLRDYSQVTSKPYCSIRREGSFVCDPRKVDNSKRQMLSRQYRSDRGKGMFSTGTRKLSPSKMYDARSSQSLQLHEPLLSSLPPRPIHSINYSRASRRWKRSDAAGAIFFNKSSDVSPEARDIGLVKGEICVVPKLMKSIWEGPSNLHGLENFKEGINVESAVLQNPSRLHSRLQRSNAKVAPKAHDFVQRSSLQIDRCDKMIKKSTDTIRASRMMVERSKGRLASTADEMKRLANKYISIF